jgi:thiol-disulfide isomerase/thioredoxin
VTQAAVTRRLRPLAWTAAVLVLVGLLTWRAVAWDSSPDGGETAGPTEIGETGLTMHPVSERQRVPGLEGNTLDGSPFDLADLAGDVVVINVWGSWCGPCRTETPDLVRLANKYSDRGVSFVGINTRDNAGAANAFVARYDVPYPSVVDDGGRVLLGLRDHLPTSAVPSTVVVDAEGMIAATVIGPVTYRTLQGLVDAELERAGADS